MAILKPEVVGWSARSLMHIDDDERPGRNDGFVDLSDIQAYRQSLEERRDRYARTHAADSLLQAFTLRAEAARQLEQTVRSAEQWMDDVRIQYLPDELANLELPLRRRATDIFRHDDEGFECRIDQIVLQKAWDRYRMSGFSIALAEIAAIARALGLKMPR